MESTFSRISSQPHWQSKIQPTSWQGAPRAAKQGRSLADPCGIALHCQTITNFCNQVGLETQVPILLG